MDARLQLGFRATALTALFAAGIGCAMAQEPAWAGMVKRVNGKVSVVRAGATLPVAEGTRLNAGDRIVTGPDSGVGIALADDTLLTAGASSRVELNDVRFDATTQDGNIFVRLLQGALHMVTGLVARQSPQNVRIETPTAVMGVRGTEFIVTTRGTDG
jgi:hypothetical protein